MATVEFLKDPLESSNKYPHITLLTCQWTAVDSNLAMQFLFDGSLSSLYD